MAGTDVFIKILCSSIYCIFLHFPLYTFLYTFFPISYFLCVTAFSSLTTSATLHPPPPPPTVSPLSILHNGQLCLFSFLLSRQFDLHLISAAHNLLRYLPCSPQVHTSSHSCCVQRDDWHTCDISFYNPPSLAVNMMCVCVCVNVILSLLGYLTGFTSLQQISFLFVAQEKCCSTATTFLCLLSLLFNVSLMPYPEFPLSGIAFSPPRKICWSLTDLDLGSI